jgi:hypothetical protein
MTYGCIPNFTVEMASVPRDHLGNVGCALREDGSYEPPGAGGD